MFGKKLILKKLFQN